MSETLKKPLNFSIGLVEHTFISFELSEYAKNNTKSIGFDKYEFTFEFNMQVNAKERQIKLLFNSNLLVKEEQLTIELSSLNLSCLFKIINFDEVIKIDSNNRMLTPNALIQTINTIALGSARGMYAMALAATPYSNAVLPLVDPKTLVPKDNQVIL
ncbi:MAG: hypothetical protein IPL84_13395 [Chitinophagaceae bacterium]|nr:hypothetical protein [Chitinophagaceae bacterium]